MWKRNLLFALLCLFGLGSVAANLLRRERIRTPRDFWADRSQQADFREVVNRINGEFQADWKKADLQPTSRADNLTLARRISLGLTGTIPSLEELDALEAIPAEHQIEWWTSRLLEDRRFSDYVAERLTRAYVGTEGGPFLVYRRRRFVTWLSDHLEKGDQPYDELVRDLIAGQGLWTDKPAVNFVTVSLDQTKENQPDPIRLANRVSRAFLGMRIDCLQCHDDKLGTVTLGTPQYQREGKQADFHRLAAFFSDANNSILGIQDKRKSYEYKFLNADKETTVPAEAPFQDNLRINDGTQRQQLARWVTHAENKAFARAAVNRFWAIVCGQPLHDPIDNIPLFGPFPPGLETLAADFSSHGYDIRRLIRLIIASDVFQRDSRADFEITPTHENHWAAFPLSRLRPEQVAGAVIQSATLSTIDAHAHIITQLQKFGETNDFVERYGDTGDDEFVDRGGTIPQRLLMMNGKLVSERLEVEKITNSTARIAGLAPNDERAVEVAYLTILTRRPTESERTAFVQQLKEAQGNERKKRVEDMCWMLLNSSEFAWNH